MSVDTKDARNEFNCVFLKMNCYFEFTCGLALILLWIRCYPECLNLIWKVDLQSVVSNFTPKNHFREIEDDR